MSKAASRRLRAYDKATGKEWRGLYAGGPDRFAHHVHRQRQAIRRVIAIGGQGFPAELVAYKLSE